MLLAGVEDEEPHRVRIRREAVPALQREPHSECEPGLRRRGRRCCEPVERQGSATDPDVIQGRPYAAPEKPAKRTPWEKELYVPEEARAYAGWRIPPANELPRVIVRFAEAGNLLVNGLLDGGSELAEKPAVVDVPHGQGHIVLFSNNPMWRNETSGSNFLLFNAIMNYRHLDVGRAAAATQ